jgi:hypothetical protein
MLSESGRQVLALNVQGASVGLMQSDVDEVREACGFVCALALLPSLHPCAVPYYTFLARNIACYAPITGSHA